MFSKVNTDVNTFDCTFFEALWKAKPIGSFYDFSKSFLKYGSSIVGTLVNVGLKKVRWL
jgi:tRNA pseudouridine38-40 synthase